MRPRSNSLFHFTNDENFLFDILKSGFWPRYCLEDIALKILNGKVSINLNLLHSQWFAFVIFR